MQKSTTRVGRNKPRKHAIVGDLRADPKTLAEEIQFAMCDSQHTVWADADHTVFVSKGEPPELPDTWIVGTYLMGAPTYGIAQDILAMWHERSKNFIVD